MQKFRLKLCDQKHQSFSLYEQYLLDKTKNVEYLDNYTRWNFYKIR